MGDRPLEGLAEAFQWAREGREDNKKKEKFPIATQVDWGLDFSTYAVLVAHFHPDRAPNLLAYMSIIFRLT